MKKSTPGSHSEDMNRRFTRRRFLETKAGTVVASRFAKRVVDREQEWSPVPHAWKNRQESSGWNRWSLGCSDGVSVNPRKMEPSVKWLHNIFGGNNMAVLTAGKSAPDFKLQTMDGKQFLLRDALARGPVVAAFFKISCPVCQYAFPFLERIYKAHGGKNVTIVGVSQNEKKDTAAFIKEYGVTFPVLLDDTNTYPTSNAYGLTNVPTIFWIGQDGEIEISSVGWERKEIEEINRKAAKINGEGSKPVFFAGEQIPDFRAG